MRIQLAALTTAAALALAVSACSPPTEDKSSDGGDTAKAATATSAKDLGSLDDLVKAAKAEGKLNVIALPPEWACSTGSYRRP